MIKLGQPLTVRFRLYDAGGTTPEAGRAGDVTAVLTLDGALDGATVTVAAVPSAPGDYVATFTPSATGTWSLALRDTLRSRDQVFAWDVGRATVDDLALASGMLVQVLPS